VPRYRRDELENIERAYHAGRERADAGALEDAIAFFDVVLGRLPRRRRDRIYRVRHTASPAGDHILWLPAVFRDALLAKAYCLNEMGHFDDAYPLVQRAVELDPENPQVYAELGFMHGTRDDYASARDAYRQAAELEPLNPGHLQALAHIALLDGDYREARGLAQRALALDPVSLIALHQYAYAEYRLGNLDGAIVALKRAVELAPLDRETVVRLAGSLREAGRIHEAIASMEALIAAGDDDPEALGLMAELLQQDGAVPQVLAHAERLLARNPHDPSGYELLAWGHFQQGNLPGALAATRRLVQLDPMQPHHHFKLGMLYQGLGDLPHSMAALQRAAVLAGDGELSPMAAEAVGALDHMQMEHIVVRAEMDAEFRARLRHDPEMALRHAGYLLSPAGQQALLNLDLDPTSPFAPDLRPRYVH
jgi:tetratricopeptide (TPR) repeat protein